MKNLTLLGLILLAIAFVLYYFMLRNFSLLELVNTISLVGILSGIGIGLIIGGMVGYISKGSAIKEEQRKRELKQLQKEKAELEKQKIELQQKAENANKI